MAREPSLVGPRLAFVGVFLGSPYTFSVSIFCQFIMCSHRTQDSTWSVTSVVGVVGLSLAVGFALGMVIYTTPSTSLYSPTSIHTTTRVGLATNAAPFAMKPLLTVGLLESTFMAPTAIHSQPTYNPIETANVSHGPSMMVQTSVLTIMAGLSFVVGTLLGKVSGNQKQPMAMASAMGRRSMALNYGGAVAYGADMKFKKDDDAPMGCRLVDPDEPGWRILGKIDIPPIVARRDIIDSLQQWLANEHREILMEKFPGYEICVDHPEDQITESTGYSLTSRFIGPSGESIVVEYCLDNRVIKTARTIEGFIMEKKENEKIMRTDGTEDPRSLSMMGTEGELVGQALYIRRDDSITLEESLRPFLAKSLQETSAALTRYYAFGNMFIDEGA